MKLTDGETNKTSMPPTYICGRPAIYVSAASLRTKTKENPWERVFAENL